MIELITKWKLRKAAKEKLRQSLIEVMELEDMRLEEEMKDLPTHQFSEEFEKNLEEILKGATRRTKKE